MRHSRLWQGRPRRLRQFHSDWFVDPTAEQLEARAMTVPQFSPLAPFGDLQVISNSLVIDQSNPGPPVLHQDLKANSGPVGGGVSSTTTGVVVPGPFIDMMGHRGPPHVTALEHGFVNTQLVGPTLPGGGTSRAIQINALHEHMDQVTADGLTNYTVIGFPNWGQATTATSRPAPGAPPGTYNLNWAITEPGGGPTTGLLTFDFSTNMAPPSDPRFAQFITMTLLTSYADVFVNAGGFPGIAITDPTATIVYFADVNYTLPVANGYDATEHRILQFPIGPALGVTYVSTMFSSPGLAGRVGSTSPPIFRGETATSQPAFTWSLSVSVNP